MTADQYRAMLKALLPPGRAWDCAPGSVMMQLLDALAQDFARVDERMIDLTEEADPRTTVEMLSDWETARGLPPPCVPLGQTFIARRNALVAKVTGGAGQSIDYYLDKLATLGYMSDRWSRYSWHFIDTENGFTALNADITTGTTSILLTANDDSPRLIREGIAFKGSKFRYIVARIKRTAGDGWTGKAYYKTAAHGESALYMREIGSAPDGVDDEYVLAVWDMHDLFNGGDDWHDSVITSIRLDIGKDDDDEYEIDWVTITPHANPDLTITIDEKVDDEPYTWRINAPSASSELFTCLSPCTMPLRVQGVELLECVMNTRKPAHTELLFGYL